MTLAEISRLESAAARIDAYQQFVEAYPNHPVAWFNLAIELEGERRYDDARAAASTAKRLDEALYATLPRSVRELLGAESKPVAREVAGYRVIAIASATESELLYDAERISDGAPVTLRRVLDLSQTGARTAFELAIALPSVDGVAHAREVVTDADGAPYLLLDRIHGAALGTARGALDAEIALRLMRSCAQRIRALHAAGALHGDLRPDLVIRDRAVAVEDQVVLLGGRRIGSAAPTPRGRLAWQSPEEAAGETASTATDVYGLALLLHHLLTGKEPGALGIRAPLATAFADWPNLDELLARATARAPGDRVSVDELIRTLDQLLARREVPQVIGKWRLGRMLGEGSFGRVFAADHVDISGMRAAVKVLRPMMASDRDMRRRFLNEASAASRIDHPNLRRVFDGGVLDDGTCYIAMELLDGLELGDLIAKGPMVPARAARLGRDAARALAKAHAIEIVHRDIKPSNLFVVGEGADERVKVLDFGIALLRGEPTRAGVPYTSTGHIWGTPEYMAPEQWQMVPDLDGRADVYALGVVLWQCLAGRHPFTATNVYEWQQAHMSASFAIIAAAPTVPARLAALIERMMAKRREDRPATMTEVADELEAILAPAATTVSITPTPTPPNDPPPPAAARGHTRMVLALGAVGVAAAGGVAIWSMSGRRTPATADAALGPPASIDARATADARFTPQLPPDALPADDACALPRGESFGTTARPEPNPAVVYAVPIDGDPVRGPSDALVTLIEATDFWSPFAFRRRDEYDAMLARHASDIRVAYKFFDNRHAGEGRVTALAACAAFRQDHFWEFADRIWQLQQQRGLGGNAANEAEAVLPDDLTAMWGSLEVIGEGLGLDRARFHRDASGADCADLVQRDSQQMTALGITGSPTYIINGRVVGGQNPDAIERVIDVEQARARRCISAGRIAAASYYDFLVREGQQRVRP